MSDLDDRFRMPESAFEAAFDSHGRNNPSIRNGMYVPTRREVAEMPPGQLFSILIDWMWESPSELIPNNTQILAVREILAMRADAKSPHLLRLINECDCYMRI